MWLFYVNIIWILVSYLISACIKKRNLRDKVFLVFSLGYLGFLTMFRLYTVGTDTKTYFTVYREIAKTNWTGFLTFMRYSGTEPGYLLFCKLLSYVSKDPQILLIFSGLISYLTLGMFFYKHSDYKFVSVFLFFTLGGFDFYASGIRQTIALSLLLIAYELSESNKRILTILFIILATSIHYSAILIIPLIFVVKIKDNSKFYLWLFVMAVGLTAGFNIVLSIILRIFPKYKYYYEGSLFSREPNLAVLLKMLVFLLLFLCAKFVVKDKNIKELAVYNKSYIFERFTAFIPIVYLISFNARAIARIAVILWPFAFVYYGNSVRDMETKNKRIVVELTVALFFVYAYIVTTYKTPEWQSTYPYSFFWQDN